MPSGNMIASHRKLAALPTESLILFTSLGRVFENGRKVFADFESFIDDIAGKAQALRNNGKTASEIVAVLFGGEDPRALLTDGQFSRENLIRAVLKMSR